MFLMEKFIQSSVLLIALTVFSIFSSEYPYVCLLISGLLMIIFTLRSLTEKSSFLLTLIQIILSIIFVLLSEGFLQFMIFYEIRFVDNKIKTIRLVFPCLFYGMVCLIGKKDSLPVIILNMMIFISLSLLIYLVEYIKVKYLSAKNQIARAVSVTAVNEMYQKKLNRELVIKNYFADKTARLEERENISLNIHNSVGHMLTAAIMTLDAADMLFYTEPQKAKEKMQAANERIHLSLDFVRRAVRVLDTEKEFISICDFIHELSEISESFVADTQIRIRSDFNGINKTLNIPREYMEFLLGVLQEALSNGVRHGGADLFTVILVTDSTNIKLIVGDNGKSDLIENNISEYIKNGFGLKKIINYTKRRGGNVSLENKNGFKIAVNLPLIKENEDE